MAAITRILERDLPRVSAYPESQMNLPSIANGPSLNRLSSSSSSPLSSPGPTSALLFPPPEPIVLDHGPFAGLSLPNASARANAAHIVRSHVSTYLITHPHLDHLAGFAVNTASFHATSRPKRLAALPFTVDAIKKHIFNDVIWPNMTDEDGGVGFVTFQRLKEGGDVMLGEGGGRGYIDVCDGLGVRAFKISHGSCMRQEPPSPHLQPHNPSHRLSVGNIMDVYHTSNGSHPSGGHAYNLRRSASIGGSYAASPAPGQPQLQTPFNNDAGGSCIVDSTAFFIRDVASAREVLIFGDVEPDSISANPRLYNIWREAAPKIASDLLAGMFIECSYDDSQPDAVLFGHLAPRHLITELQTLADMVNEEKSARALEKSQRKRKRSSQLSVSQSMPGSAGLNDAMEKKRNRSLAAGRTPSTPLRRSSTLPDEEKTTTSGAPSPRRLRGHTPKLLVPPPPEVEEEETIVGGIDSGPPLLGLRVVIIHVKDTLKDGPHVSERILRELNEHAAALEEGGWGRLGCEFIISESGADYMF